MTITPQAQTICSGTQTNIVITSTIPTATFSWTSVTSTSLSGASAGMNDTIAQTLTNSGITQDTAWYVVTPSANGCFGTVDTAIVFVNPIPVMIVSPVSDTICSATSTAITLGSNVLGTTYSWTQVSGVTVTGASSGSGSLFTNQVLTNTGSAMDSVTYTFTPSAAGCIGSTVNAVVSVTPAPTVTPSYTTQSICSGSAPANATLTGTPASATFSWTANSSSAAITGFSAGNGSVINGQTLTNSSNVSGTVTYTITPTANGCTGITSTVTITVNPIPTVVITSTPSSVCSGGTTNVALTSNVATAGFTYTSSSPAVVTGASNGFGSLINQTLTSTSSVAETVTYTITASANGCSSNSVATVTVNPIPASPVLAGAASYCLGSPINALTATGTTGATFNWYDNSALTPVLSSNASFTPSLSSTTTYYATQTVNGCTSAPSATTVTILPAPDAVISATPTTGMAPLLVSFGNSSTNAVTYAWTFGNGDTSSTFAPSVTYEEMGTYHVVLIATNGNCTDSTSLDIIVEGKSFMIIPNVFTPNGDGSNDEFRVQNQSITTFNLQIFDRWGIKMFSTETVDTGWDGKSSSGTDASDGTYFYILKAEGKDGVSYSQKGHLLLIRK
jgi:gliding motility-associated-like protein